MRSTKKTIPRLSVVIPVFNEEIRVNNLYKLHEYFSKKKYIKEYIVVNDGSTDTTLSQLRTIRRKTDIHIVSYKKNRGKGYAIRKGIETSSGTHILFLDVDLSTDLGATDEFVKRIPEGNVIIGTRKSSGAKLIERQPFLRELMGKAFTTLSSFILGVSVSDFTCGFKCYEAKLAKRIARKQKIARWAYDNEYLFLAKKLGEGIIEVPVAWKNDRKTKVRFPQDILSSLRDIFFIRLNAWMGKYK